MSRIISVLCAFIIFCFLVLPARAELTPTVVQPGSLLPHMQWLADPGGNMDITAVMSREIQERFITLPESPRQLGMDNEAVWIRISFAPTTGPQHWTLDLGWDYFTSVSMYRVSRNGSLRMTEERATEGFTMSPRLDLRVSTTETVDYYIRLTGHSGFVLSPVLLDDAGLTKRLLDRAWGLGLFFGLAGAMLAFNLVLLVYLRDSAYLWYVLHLATATFYYLLFVGVIEPPMIASSPAANAELMQRLIAVLTGIVFVLITGFSRSFLMTRDGSPRLHLALSLLMLSGFGLMGLTLVTDVPTIVRAISLLGTTIAAVAIVCGIVRIMDGFRAAIPYVLGWGAFLIFASSTTFAFTGVLPWNFLTANGLLIGTGIETILMAIALAYRVRTLREEKGAVEKERDELDGKNAFKELILENSSLGIAFVKGNRIEWANHRLSDFLELPQIGLSGSDVRSLVQRPGGKIVRPFLETRGELAKNRVFTQTDSCPQENGSRLHYRIMGSAVDMEHPENGAVWMVEDISQRQHLESLKRDMDRIMRHDIRSPLTSIAGAPELLEAGDNLTPAQLSITAKIRNTANRLIRYLELSLALQRMEAGDYRPELTPVEFTRVLEAVMDELRAFTDNNDVPVIVEADGKPMPEGRKYMIRAEQTLLHAMLYNLLRNGFEAVPEGGEIRVNVERKGNDQVINVRNSGSVPGSVRDTFFEKYATAGKMGGLGLGTYSVRLMARALGGEAELVSHGDGPDMVEVRVTFPREGHA